MTRFWDILQWALVGAILVAAFANSKNIATSITAFGHDFFVPTVLTIASAGQYRPPS